MLESQIQCATALILCTISSIITIIPFKSTSTKMFIFVIITPVAATLECILILSYILGHISFSLAGRSEFLLNVPYSIVLSGLGTVSALIGCVIGVVVYRKAREEDFQKKYFTMDHVIPLTTTE